ncbi:unnamed protein product [Prunus armeniaca]|uniref:Uncharacterized protein n=1 Tax=Prunus armeniaca TaxID=36596 RepID=A0A6J5VTC7_PRUAR|nr:unnamed protein product [Prunus armeniaca]
MGMWTPGGNEREMEGARRKRIRQALDSKPGGLGASTDMDNETEEITCCLSNLSQPQNKGKPSENFSNG